MQEEPSLLHPRPLAPGSTLGICAPAGPVDEEALAAGIRWLEGAGYAVRCARHLHGRQGYLAGPDAERLEDLLELWGAPEVRGIILARGGYGIARILRQLDPSELRRARKLVVGYSDATSLLLFLRRHAGLAAVHGPMLERADVTEAARARLLALVRGEPAALEPLEGSGVAGGRASGPLVGGGLTLIASSLGTPWEIDTRGAIVFLEEVCEEPYAIDRLLVQLREAGKLREAAGIAVGQLVQCESERYPEFCARDVVREVLASEVEGPIVEDLPFGHIADNRALGFGVKAELDGKRGTLTLLEPVVRGED
jgi:muramoyltetrapeptide carboxypeptidase